eukprot:144210-Alexandrium_andersonii.AAC.1
MYVFVLYIYTYTCVCVVGWLGGTGSPQTTLFASRLDRPPREHCCNFVVALIPPLEGPGPQQPHPLRSAKALCAGAAFAAQGTPCWQSARR